jgi:hypothetical protein
VYNVTLSKSSSSTKSSPSTIDSTSQEHPIINPGHLAVTRSNKATNPAVWAGTKYSSVPVYYINANTQMRHKDAIVTALYMVATFLVLLEDAQEWYELEDFLRLLKTSSHMLIFSALYSVMQSVQSRDAGQCSTRGEEQLGAG